MNRRQKKRKEKRYFQHLLILTKPKSTEMFEPPTQGIMDPANLLTLKSKYKNSLQSISTTSFLIPSETSKRLFVQDLIFPSLFPRNDVSWFQSVFDERVCFADLGMPSTKKFNRDKDETKYWRILTTIISGGLKIWYRQGFKTNQFFLSLGNKSIQFNSYQKIVSIAFLEIF